MEGYPRLLWSFIPSFISNHLNFDTSNFSIQEKFLVTNIETKLYHHQQYRNEGRLSISLHFHTRGSSLPSCFTLSWSKTRQTRGPPNRPRRKRKPYVQSHRYRYYYCYCALLLLWSGYVRHCQIVQSRHVVQVWLSVSQWPEEKWDQVSSIIYLSQRDF
jgi:hypothetical protein